MTSPLAHPARTRLGRLAVFVSSLLVVGAVIVPATPARADSSWFTLDDFTNGGIGRTGSTLGTATWGTTWQPEGPSPMISLNNGDLSLGLANAPDGTSGISNVLYADTNEGGWTAPIEYRFSVLGRNAETAANIMGAPYMRMVFPNGLTLTFSWGNEYGGSVGEYDPTAGYVYFTWGGAPGGTQAQPGERQSFFDYLNWQTSGFQEFRLRILPNEIDYKRWASGEPEPGTWTTTFFNYPNSYYDAGDSGAQLTGQNDNAPTPLGLAVSYGPAPVQMNPDETWTFGPITAMIPGPIPSGPPSPLSVLPTSVVSAGGFSGSLTNPPPDPGQVPLDPGLIPNPPVKIWDITSDPVDPYAPNNSLYGPFDSAAYPVTPGDTVTASGDWYLAGHYANMLLCFGPPGRGTCAQAGTSGTTAALGSYDNVGTDTLVNTGWQPFTVTDTVPAGVTAAYLEWSAGSDSGVAGLNWSSSSESNNNPAGPGTPATAGSGIAVNCYVATGGTNIPADSGGQGVIGPGEVGQVTGCFATPDDATSTLATVDTMIELDNVPTGIDFGHGVPYAVLNPSASSIVVTTNSLDGYDLLAAFSDLGPVAPGFTSPELPDTIPASAISWQMGGTGSWTAFVTDVPVIIATQHYRSSETGDSYSAAVQMHVPFVNAAAYTGTATFTATTL